MAKKTTQGRKKIKIKKIEQVRNRQVNFSKRRGYLFKKASELCVLTGSELAIMVHSPGGQVFALSNLSADQVVDRYLNNGGTSKESPPPPMNEFNQLYSEISKELENEKKKKEIIQESNSMKNGDLWWDESIDGLALEEVEHIAWSLQELKNKAIMRADELMMIKSSSLSS